MENIVANRRYYLNFPHPPETSTLVFPSIPRYLPENSGDFAKTVTSVPCGSFARGRESAQPQYLVIILSIALVCLI